LEAQTTKGLGGKEPNMLIIGCDYHPSCQQIAFVDTETGELGERRLLHREEAEGFYIELKEPSLSAQKCTGVLPRTKGHQEQGANCPAGFFRRLDLLSKGHPIASERP
jgi:hypothetical protein